MFWSMASGSYLGIGSGEAGTTTAGDTEVGDAEVAIAGAVEAEATGG